MDINKIYLPTLRRISIKDFSLYPKGLDFTFEFIDGVNLIVGGNGIGKTTFVNLIKYGLIGLYRKHKDSKRYKEKQIIKREQYSEDFFKNRMDKNYYLNTEAKVTISFSIKNTLFTVTRSLYDIQLEKVLINEDGVDYELEGYLVKQHKYEKLSNEEKTPCLQYKYEEKVSKLANLYEFDDFIFFVNEILVFGENRKTVLWDIELQEDLSSKYFNDPKLDNEYQNLKMDAKYYDSLSRHKSEDMRAVRLVLDKIKVDDNHDISNKNLVSDINYLKTKIDRSIKKLETIQNERKAIEGHLRIKISEKTNKTKEQQDIEAKIRYEERKIYKELWEQLNPQYNIYLKYIKDNVACPMCNKEIDDELYYKLSHNESNCIFCNKPIKNIESESGNISMHKASIVNILTYIQNIEREICEIESELKVLDNEFDRKKTEITKMQAQLRDFEFSFGSQNISNNNDTITIKKMMNEIDLLENEKLQLQEKSKRCIEQANNIADRMDQNRINITLELSDIFSKFAGLFLAAKCELTYDDIDGRGNRYIPSINDSMRIYPDELSESQSFFIDHSFRMSLLRFFYTTPAFFICETPESSLDISYEINAANIFLKYLDRPNSLIITSNLNNSEFLDYIVEHAPKISYVNLLDIGRPTDIQNLNTNLVEISNRIEAKISGKRS